MPRREDSDAKLPARMPSLLDLLIEDEPSLLASRTSSRSALVSAIKRALLRDIEGLLNTRRCALNREIEKSLPELKTSVLSFGIPDFTAMDIASGKRRIELVKLIEQAIRQFEPRIGDVSVTLLETKEALERRLHLRIEALIRVEPVFEPAVFESLLDPASQSFSVWAAEYE
jgi:type VI secretion system protein ImpF